MQPYEIIPGPSELRLRVRGADLKQLFRHALLGMFNSLEAELIEEPHSPNTWADFTKLHHVELSGSDTETLLVNFLSEALHLSLQYREVFSDMEIEHLDGQRIVCNLMGKPFLAIHGREIKAIAHRDVRIQKAGSGLLTDIIFNI